MKDLVLFILLLTSISCYSQEDIIRSQDIESVTVEATRGKEIAFEDSKYYIIDFHINNQGKFLLVSNRRKYFVYLLDTRMEVKDKMKLDFHPRSIYYDCLGLLHVLAKDSMYQIEIIEDKLVIYERNSIMLLTRFFNNCVAESNETVIFKVLKNYNQSTIYYGHNKLNHLKTVFYRVEDSVLIKSAADEKRRISSEGYSNHGRLSELDTKALKAMRIKEDRARFFVQKVSRPDYHPLFVHNDTIYVFDHLNDKMVKLDSQGELISEKAIRHHYLKKWDNRIYLDKATGVFYATEVEQGAQTLSRMNSNSFNIAKKTKITKHSFPKKIIIHDGFAYYTYKKYVDDNLNKLFRQRLY